MVKTLFARLLMFVLIPSTAFAASNQVELTLEKPGAITIPVTINGQGPFVFMLDTGSNRSIVSSALAARLALPVVAKAAMVTSTGRQDYSIVRIDRVVIGDAASLAVLASLVPASKLRAAAARIDGVVGQDFLSRFNYTLDYRTRRLSWAAASPSDDRDVRLPIVKQEGRFLVELPHGDRTLRLVPDSAAEIFVIFERNGVAPVALAPAARRERDQLVSVTGMTDIRVMLLPRLQVGSAIIGRQPALLVPRNEPDAPAGDGLLPLHLFSSASFNCSEGYIVLRK
jgi:hypothetical protein